METAVYKSKKSFKEAKLVEVLSASAERIAPLCPSFGKCGGCSLQHTNYANQVKIKEGYVRELLDKFCPDIAPCSMSPSQWNYRNKMEFSFFHRSGAGLDLGLHEKNEFNRYFPVPPCSICDEDFLDAAQKIKDFALASGLPVYDKRSNEGFYRHLVLRKGIRTGQLLVNLVVASPDFRKELFGPLVEALKGKVSSFYLTINGSVSDVVQADEVRLLHGVEMIEEALEVKGKRYLFSISPFSFFQTNTLGTEKLYEAVLELGNFKSSDSVLDLYCGTGTIGIVIAPCVKKVLGVEQVAQAVENAELNKKKNNLENVSFEAGTLEKWVKSAVPGELDVIILDPPRGGLSGKVIDFVLKCAPEKIIYVSCNPATLARDLSDIAQKSGYRAVKMAVLDMFPQTYHVETVTLLTK